MAGVSVANEVGAFRAAVEGIKRTEMQRAAAIALNRTADGVRVEASRLIRKLYKLKAGAVNKAFSIQRASAEKLTAVVRASGRPINLIDFSARQTRKGVTVDVKGQRKLIPHAFIASSNGGRAVFIRAGKDRRWYPGAPRKPIQSLYSVDVPGLFAKDIASNAIPDVAVDRFKRELEAAIRSIILRRN